jgi:hypothetical protein
MVALARNLDFLGSRFLTGLTAVFVASLHHAPAWQVRTLDLLIYRHHLGFSFLNVVLKFPDLPSFHHQAEQCSCGDACRKRGRNR